MHVMEDAMPVSEEMSYSRDEEVYENLRERSSRGTYSPFISILLPYEEAAERYRGAGILY